MKPVNFAIFALLLIPAFASTRAQDETKPIIPAPPRPAPVQAPPPAPTGPLIVSPDYVIGPQDGLNISVWKDPTLSGSVEVRPDGMITLPLLGDVKAVGFTPTQFAADLTERLKKFVVDPLVTVSVVAIKSKQIFFTGEIRIGEMPYNPNITILQAIISDGGPTAFANKKKIYILRTVKGKQVKIPFNYVKAVKTGDQQGVTLLPGDTIVVP